MSAKTSKRTKRKASRDGSYTAVERCRVNGKDKVCYRSEAAARKAARKSHEQAGKKIYAYACRHGAHFHLSKRGPT